MNSDNDYSDNNIHHNQANRDVVASDSTIARDAKVNSGVYNENNYYGWSPKESVPAPDTEDPALRQLNDPTAPLSKRSRTFNYKTEDLIRWTQQLIEKRLLILQCEDSKLLTDVGYTVAAELEAKKEVEVRNQRVLGFEREEREEFDANYRMLYDGTIETKSPSFVMVIAVVAQSRVFVKSLPTAEETAIHTFLDRLAQEDLNRYVLVLGTRESLSLSPIYDEYRETVDFLLPRLEHHYKERSNSLHQELLAQINQGRWPADAREFFQQIRPSLEDGGLKKEIERRGKLELNQDAENEIIRKASLLLSSKDQLKNTVLFIATYFTGLSARDFESAVLCLVGDREMTRKVSHITGSDGTYKAEDRDEKQPLRKTWEEKYGEVLDSCRLDFQQPSSLALDTKDLVGPRVPVVEFTDERLRKALHKVFWTSGHKVYLELLERVFAQRLFFEHQSDAVMEGVIRLIVETAEADPSLHGQDWLFHLTFDSSSPAVSKPSAESINQQGADEIRKKKIYYYRMNHLILEMVSHEKLLGMVTSFLNKLVDHSPDDLRELLWRLRSTDRIDVFPWWKKLLNRDSHWANMNVCENIVASALGDEQRLVETIRRVGEWLPEENRSSASVSERTSPGLITDLCLRMSLGRRERSAASWPPLNPLLKALNGPQAESIAGPLFSALASTAATDILRSRWRRHISSFIRIRLLSQDVTGLWPDHENTLTKHMLKLWSDMLSAETGGNSGAMPGPFLPQALILADWVLDLRTSKEKAPEESRALLERIMDFVVTSFDNEGKRFLAGHWANFIQLQQGLISELSNQAYRLLSEETTGPFQEAWSRLTNEMGTLRNLSNRVFPFSDGSEEEEATEAKPSNSTGRSKKSRPENRRTDSGTGESQPVEPPRAAAENNQKDEASKPNEERDEPDDVEPIAPDGELVLRPPEPTPNKLSEPNLMPWRPPHQKLEVHRHLRGGLIAAVLTIALLGTWLLFLRGGPETTAVPTASPSALEGPRQGPPAPGAGPEASNQTEGNTIPSPREPTVPVPGSRAALPPTPPPEKAPERPRPQQQREAAELLVQGQKMMARGDTTQARDAYARATRLAPEDAYGWANLGAAEMVLGNVESAERAYRKALQIDDDNWLARYNLGTHLARSGRSTEALEQLSRTISTLRRLGETKHLEDVRRDMAKSAAFTDLHNDQKFQLLFKP